VLVLLLVIVVLFVFVLLLSDDGAMIIGVACQMFLLQSCLHFVCSAVMAMITYLDDDGLLPTQKPASPTGCCSSIGV